MKSIRKNLRGLAIISALIGSLNFVHAQTTARAVQSINAAPVDSIVRIVADSEELSPLLPEEVPLYGTFWTVFPGLGGIPVPMPCPPLDPSFPIYTIADGQFLVDETGGVLPQPTGRQAMMGVSSATLIQTQMNMVLDLIGQVQEAQANTERRAMALDVPMPGDGGDGDTNAYTFNASGFTVDYGTNLYIAQVGISSGNLVGIISNSPAAVKLEMQSRSDLLQTNWDSAGFVYGSEVTNWTPFSVAMSSPSNLFVRIRSWADDGSGLPIWWQTQYFGYVGVDPYGNPAGDGWNNLQKFQNGMNPNVFYTPPAPQGVTVSLNQSSQTAAINWLPASGNVTGYTVEKSYQPFYYSSPQISDFSTTTPCYLDSIAGNNPDPWSGDAYDVTYRVQAHYSTGGSSDWSPKMPLQPTTVSAAIVPGANGATVLAVSGVPANAATVRLVFIDTMAVSHGDTSFNYSEDIPVSSFTNGLYQLPAAWYPPSTDAYGDAWYAVYVESVDVNGNASAAKIFDSKYGWRTYYNWSLPFYDGRVQLKQNLIFQLRAAGIYASFQYYSNFNGFYYVAYASPTNYAFASFYDCKKYGNNDAYYSQTFNLIRPFLDNSLYRNFVFTPADVDSGGYLATGASLDSYGPVSLNAPVKYQFQGDPANQPALLSANSARWLLYDASDTWPDYNVVSIGLVTPDFEQLTYSMSSGYRNWFGLPYLSVNMVYQKYDDGGNALGLATNVLDAGTTLSLSENDVYSIASGAFQNIYPETAQPQFQTVEYDFWQPSIIYPLSLYPNIYSLPGNPYFLTTNASESFIITSVGSSLTIAGYAKLAVTNGYSGMYGYLGQYFDQAYKKDDNGNVTTNTTGVLSPYGDFFATEPGPAALVTMPDPDTGARGTCTVYCVFLQLDRNHDGNMDTSFSGPDNTSASSPYTHWRNNNFDRWHDVDCTPIIGGNCDSEQDDLGPDEVAGLPAYQQVPDYDYVNSYSQRVIPNTRDLEDYARLWICGITTNLIAALPQDSSITLSWDDVGNPNPKNPTIDVFQATDPDGGIGYLTNAVAASQQIQSAYIGRLRPGNSLPLYSYLAQYAWPGSHYIWCGVTNGTGKLILTIKSGTNVLAQTSTYIQIVDIKQMYERWTVGDNPKVAPTNTAQLAANDLPDPTQPPFQYAPNTDTNTPYILFVHGWNLPTWGKDRFAETAYKRLYWQGYQGRFGLFRWPTLYDFPAGEMSWQAWNPDNFDTSEFQSWKSGAALRKLLVQLNNEYPGHLNLFSHSHGNIAVGEALRTNVTLVQTYVAVQAAVPSHAYDISRPFRTLDATGVNLDSGTIERTAIYWTNGAACYFYSNAGASNCVNFFNFSDWALSWWMIDQDKKPDFGYNWYPLTNGIEAYYYSTSPNSSRDLYFPQDTYEIYSYIIEGRCYALGQQADVGGAFNLSEQIDLSQPPYSFGGLHKGHSAEFRNDNMNRWQFWNEVLKKMNLKH